MFFQIITPNELRLSQWFLNLSFQHTDLANIQNKLYIFIFFTFVFIYQLLNFCFALFSFKQFSSLSFMLHVFFLYFNFVF